MSVIASYAHLSPEALADCRSNDDWVSDLYSQSIPDSAVIDIDKACEGIVWILSRLPAPPSSNLAGAGFVMERSLAPSLRGGAIERSLEASLGPASSLSVDDVAELSSWLQSVTLDQIRPLYDPFEMEADSVYPDIWMEEGAAALNEYLLPNIQKLQQFFSRAARANHVVIVFFT